MVKKLKSEEISSIIKDKINSFDVSVDIAETGRVIGYADGVAKVYGLKNVMSYEMVEFETGDVGLASNLEEGNVGVVILGNGSSIREGMSVKLSLIHISEPTRHNY